MEELSDTDSYSSSTSTNTSTYDSSSSIIIAKSINFTSYQRNLEKIYPYFAMIVFNENIVKLLVSGYIRNEEYELFAEIPQIVNWTIWFYLKKIDGYDENTKLLSKSELFRFLNIINITDISKTCTTQQIYDDMTSLSGHIMYYPNMISIDQFITFFCSSCINPDAMKIRLHIHKQTGYQLLMKVVNIFQSFDKNQSGKLEFEQFIQFGRMLQLNITKIFDIWNIINIDKSSEISISDTFEWFKMRLEKHAQKALYISSKKEEDGDDSDSSKEFEEWNDYIGHWKKLYACFANIVFNENIIKSVVYGYIRDQQHTLFVYEEAQSSYYNIPELVNYIVLFYLKQIDNYEENTQLLSKQGLSSLVDIVEITAMYTVEQIYDDMRSLQGAIIYYPNMISIDQFIGYFSDCSINPTAKMVKNHVQRRVAWQLLVKAVNTFHKVDKNKTGKLGFAEFTEFGTMLNLNQTETEGLWNVIDSDQCGEVTIIAVFAWFKRRLEAAKKSKKMETSSRSHSSHFEDDNNEQEVIYMSSESDIEDTKPSIISTKLHEHSIITSISSKHIVAPEKIDWQKIGQILLDYRFLPSARIINQALDHLETFCENEDLNEKNLRDELCKAWSVMDDRGTILWEVLYGRLKYTEMKRRWFYDLILYHYFKLNDLKTTNIVFLIIKILRDLKANNVDLIKMKQILASKKINGYSFNEEIKNEYDFIELFKTLQNVNDIIWENVYYKLIEWKSDKNYKNEILLQDHIENNMDLDDFKRQISAFNYSSSMILGDDIEYSNSLQKREWKEYRNNLKNIFRFFAGYNASIIKQKELRMFLEIYDIKQFWKQHLYLLQEDSITMDEFIKYLCNQYINDTVRDIKKHIEKQPEWILLLNVTSCLEQIDIDNNNKNGILKFDDFKKFGETLCLNDVDINILFHKLDIDNSGQINIDIVFEWFKKKLLKQHKNRNRRKNNDNNNIDDIDDDDKAAKDSKNAVERDESDELDEID